MEKPIFIIGHRNPDTDSICSAIAYSHLKNTLGFYTQAARLGPLSKETQYVLKRFDFTHPPLIYSAKCTLSEIDKDEALLVSRSTTMKEALDLILQRKNKGVFVTNQQGRLEGIVSISDLTNLWTSDEEALQELMQRVSLDNLVKTTQASILHDASFIPNGKVQLLPSLCQDSSIVPGTIVIVGNSPELQRIAIQQQAALILICGEKWVDSITMDMAQTNQIPIIHSPLSAITVAHSIFQSPSIDEIMTKDVVSFHNNETVDGASQRIAKTRFRTYPVLNENEEVIGAISRFHLFNYSRSLSHKYW